MCPQENVTISIKQSLPFYPLRHVQVSGAVHSLLVAHGKMQIAVMRGNNNVSTRKCNHTCQAVIDFGFCPVLTLYNEYSLTSWYSRYSPLLNILTDLFPRCYEVCFCIFFRHTFLRCPVLLQLWHFAS